MGKALSPGELPEYAQDLLSEVVAQSGYPLVLVETDGLGYDSQLRMAGPTQPFHELTYVPVTGRLKTGQSWAPIREPRWPEMVTFEEMNLTPPKEDFLTFAIRDIEAEQRTRLLS